MELYCEGNLKKISWAAANGAVFSNDPFARDEIGDLERVCTRDTVRLAGYLFRRAWGDDQDRVPRRSNHAVGDAAEHPSGPAREAPGA